MDERFISEMGKRILDLRKRLRWTQEEMAERSDTTKQTVSMAENGKQELRASLIVKISDALGVSTDYLLKGTRTDADRILLDQRIQTLSSDQYDFISETINKFIDLCDKGK